MLIKFCSKSLKLQCGYIFTKTLNSGDLVREPGTEKPKFFGSCFQWRTIPTLCTHIESFWVYKYLRVLRQICRNYLQKLQYCTFFRIFLAWCSLQKIQLHRLQICYKVESSCFDHQRVLVVPSLSNPIKGIFWVLIVHNLCLLYAIRRSLLISI